MIDIHCHILPGLDDGAQTMEEAVAMARTAVEDGITTMVATPHYWEGMFTPTAQEVRRAVGDLQDRLADEGILLKLLPGHEVMMGTKVPERLRKGDLLTLGDGGEYLLIELPVFDIPMCTEQVLFEVMSLGVTPILAHPEKNAGIQQDPALLARIVERGCLVQMDADSLARGRWGGTARFAARLLKAGLVHLIASDGHSSRQRPPLISPYASRAARITSPKLVEEMTGGLPARIVGPARVTISAAGGLGESAPAS